MNRNGYRVAASAKIENKRLRIKTLPVAPERHEIELL